MKRIFALIALAAVLASCATSDPVATTDLRPEAPATTEPHTEAPRRLVPRMLPPRALQVGLPMPFGDSMFGPWRTGRERDEFVPDPKEKLTIDPDGRVVSKTSLHKLLMNLATRAGLPLWIEPSVPDAWVTVLPHDVEPRQAIRNVCKANKLSIVEEGELWVIISRPCDDLPVHVTKGDLDGYYHVEFDEQEIVEAIMEVAVVTGAHVLIPSILSTEEDEDSEEHIGPIDRVRITLRVRNATPDHILRELARLGNKDIEVIVAEGDQPAYKFGYRK